MYPPTPSPWSTMAEMGDMHFGAGMGSQRAPTNDSVKFIKRLGSGVFGEVWEAEYRGETVAAKVTQCPTGFRTDELALLRRAQGEHTVRLIAEEEGTPKGTAIIMELCDGSLHDNKPRTEDDFLKELAQILHGLVTLHEQGVIFGDLKPDNLLRTMEGKVVFADFGDARDTKIDTRGRSVHEQGWGSPMYHARPDVMKQSLTLESDMWMFAQTAIHLWTGEEARSNPTPLPDDIPLRPLLQQCFSSSPASRPSAQEALDLCEDAMHPTRSPVRSTRRRASLPSPSRSTSTSPQSQSQFRRRRSQASMYDYVRESVGRLEASPDREQCFMHAFERPFEPMQHSWLQGPRIPMW